MRIATNAAIAAAALAFATTAAAQRADSLTRFECGTSRPAGDLNERFSDTFAYAGGLKMQLVFSCYLIKHGSDYMIWDTGFGPDAGATAPKMTLPQQLEKLGVKPEQVKFVGISHYHPDHMGQARAFPHATLLIGKGDWDVLKSPVRPDNVNPALLEPWINGGGKVEPLYNDKDVFGDGSVLILNTPGHTPGHHSVLVKLQQTGNVILVGDAAHFHENYETNGVPWFNHDRSQTLASLDRIKKLAANLKATVVIQHDPRDVAKLPAFPESAK
ncbi:MAG: N-acyl homoserine lactonase family protein [Betaproteobacteria bacterium]